MWTCVALSNKWFYSKSVPNDMYVALVHGRKTQKLHQLTMLQGSPMAQTISSRPLFAFLTNHSTLQLTVITTVLFSTSMREEMIWKGMRECTIVKMMVHKCMKWILCYPIQERWASQSAPLWANGWWADRKKLEGKMWSWDDRSYRRCK